MILSYDRNRSFRRTLRRSLPLVLYIADLALLTGGLFLIVSARFSAVETAPVSDAQAIAPSDSDAEASRFEGLTIIQQYSTQNDCYITNQHIQVEGIMLHSIGVSQSSAEILAENFNTFNPSGSAACPHAFLQSDGIVYQILPWNLYGWHAGGSANRPHIGLEMCEPDSLVYTSASEFYTTDAAAATAYVEGTYRTAVTLCAKLCTDYSLDPLEDGVILSHAEGSALGIASDHGDPEHLWSGLGLPYTMDTFRADVDALMRETQS